MVRASVMGAPDNYDTLQRQRAQYRRTAPWAALKVQTAVRRRQAKARVARLKQEQLEQRAAERKAAVVIQAHDRGHAERRRRKREAELALRPPAAIVIQSHWRRWQKRSVLADIRDRSFRRRRAVLENDLEDQRRRQAEVDARVAALEEAARLEKVAKAESHRRAQLIKVKREDERNAKALARETERQRKELRDGVARGRVDKRHARLEEEAVLEEYAIRALAAKDLVKSEELQKKLQASLVTNVERELAVQHAEEEYSVASQRRDDREALASLCKELGGRSDALTGAGVGELFRALDPEGYRPEKLPDILAEMGAKTITPLPGSVVPRPLLGMTAVQAALEVLAQESNANMGVVLDRLVKWFDRRGAREIAELLGIQMADRLSAAAVLRYVLKLRADEKVLYAARYCQRVWRGKHARLATVPQIQQRRAQLQAQLQAQREKEARDQLRRRDKAALVLETYVRGFLARRRVQRMRQRAINLQKLAQQKAESRRQAQLRLTGRSDYHTISGRDAAGVRVAPHRTSGADVFAIHEEGQVVESIWPKNWLRCSDEHSGRAYWYNRRTCESRWDAPPELAGLRPTMKHAKSAHEDGSWTERQNYKARTASVTAGVYGSRQPRHERARLIRRSGRPQSLPSARHKVGSVGAPGQGSEAKAVDRRPREETSASGNHPQSQRRPERPASARPTSTARSKRPHSAFRTRPASAGRFNRPQNPFGPHQTSDRSAGDLHAAMRRAHVNQLSQPKAIAAALRLHSPRAGAQFEAHPPPMNSSVTFKARDPIIPTAAFFSQHRSSEPRRRPQSARAAVHVRIPSPVGASQKRPQSAAPSRAPTARKA